MNNTLMDAVARFTDADTEAFRREWNAQFEEEQAVALEEKTKQPPKAGQSLIQGGISVHVLMKYLDAAQQTEERQVVIRRVFQTQKDIFVDILCLDLHAPRLVKLDNIIQIVDMNTKTLFANPRGFFETVLKIDLHENNKAVNKNTSSSQISTLKDGELKTAIELTRYEITALLFFSGVDGTRDPAELRTVVEYVHERCPNLSFNDNDLMQYLQMIYPDNQSFYYALERIIGQETWIVRMFVEKLVSLIKADGHIDEKEKLFLSDFLRVLEEEGFDLTFIK